MLQKCNINEATLSLGNSQVTLYGDAAKMIEIIAVSAFLMIAVSSVVKALQ